MLAPNPASGHTGQQLFPSPPPAAEHGYPLRAATRPGPGRLSGVMWAGGAKGANWSLRLRKGLRWPDRAYPASPSLGAEQMLSLPLPWAESGAGGGQSTTRQLSLGQSWDFPRAITAYLIPFLG